MHTSTSSEFAPSCATARSKEDNVFSGSKAGLPRCPIHQRMLLRCPCAAYPLAMSTDVALVTHEGLPDLDVDDQPLVGALAAVGVAARPAVWSDERVDWSRF